MKIISHRGNTEGSNTNLENNPEYIIDSIKKGFDTEVDLWYFQDKLYLGHDSPLYQIDLEWILYLKDKLWVHCKNVDCVNFLYGTDINYFWHNSDDLTITSKGYIWTQPNIYIKNGINVCLEYKEIYDVYGVCTDNPIKFKSKYE